MVSCSTEKDDRINKFYHSTTAHYNGYFNAKELIKESMSSLKISYKENTEGVFDGMFITWGDDHIAEIIKGDTLHRPQFNLLLDEKIIQTNEIDKIKSKIHQWRHQNYLEKW